MPHKTPDRKIVFILATLFFTACTAATPKEHPKAHQIQLGAYHVVVPSLWWSNISEQAGPDLKTQNAALSSKMPFQMGFMGAFQGRQQEMLLISQLTPKGDLGGAMGPGPLTNYLQSILRKVRAPASQAMIFLPRADGGSWLIRFSSQSNEIYKLIGWKMETGEAVMLDLVAPRSSHTTESLAEYKQVLEQHF